MPAAAGRGRPARLLATTLEADPFLGRILTGRITSGTVRPNQTMKALSRDGRLIETFRAKGAGLPRTGAHRVEVAEAGDIVAIAGMKEANVADTLCDPAVGEPLPAQPVDPPTLSMTFRINDGPFAGQEGDKVQSRVIRERLLKEAERNIAIRVSESDDKDAYTVAGRGELQLAILIENMRREGFELTVSRPRLSTRSRAGQRLEPIEEVIIDVDDAHTGVVVSTLSERKGELVEMRPSGGGRTRMVFYVTRGLLGYQSELLSGHARHGGDEPHLPRLPTRSRARSPAGTGVLVSNGVGEATAYALFYLQDRGPAMIAPQTRVYEGMIVGEHTRDNDLVVNITQGKKLSNVRAAGKDENLILTPPMRMTLEKAMSYIADDELVEVTPSRDPPAQALARPQRAQEAGAPSARPSARRAWRDAGLDRRRGSSRLSPLSWRGGTIHASTRWP